MHDPLLKNVVCLIRQMNPPVSPNNEEQCDYKIYS